ncbi:MAG: hypothetical protein ACE5GE_07405 [Phycisphaerae bacterium]
MTIDQVRAVHRAQPFQPFTIHLADGRSFHVDHPEFLALSRGGRTIILSIGEESHQFIDVLLITSLELSNGHRVDSQ